MSGWRILSKNLCVRAEIVGSLRKIGFPGRGTCQYLGLNPLVG